MSVVSAGRRAARVARVVLAVGFGITAGSCPAQARQVRESTRDTAIPTRGSIGFSVLTVWDSSRSWEWAPDADAAGRAATMVPRPLRISMWYPARPSARRRMRVADYLVHPSTHDPSGDDASRRLDARDKRTFIAQVLDGDGSTYAAAASLQLTAVRHATAARGRAPLVLYSAGLNSFDTDNAMLAETLAREGYVVATVAQQGRSSDQLDLTLAPADVETQVRDLEFALATLRRMPNVDPRRLALIGWSMGAVATLLLQMRHPEVSAVVALDPSYAYRNHPSRVTAAASFAATRMTVPMLVLEQASADVSDAVVDSLVYSARDIVRFPSVVHEDFAMGAELAAVTGARTARRSTAHAVHMSRDVSLRTVAFLNAHLRGDSAGLSAARMPRGDTSIPVGTVQLRYLARTRPPVSASQLALLVTREGFDSAASLLGLRAPATASTLLRERDVNALAYSLLGADQRATAVSLFRLNARTFPESANAFDSLADGLIATGDDQGARDAYRRVLELLETDSSLSAETRDVLRRNATRFLERVPRGHP